MLPVYRLLVFLIVLFTMLLVGYRSYIILDNKIRESNTGWKILAYAILLLLVNAFLFVGGLFLLIYSYAFLSGAG